MIRELGEGTKMRTLNKTWKEINFEYRRLNYIIEKNQISTALIWDKDVLFVKWPTSLFIESITMDRKYCFVLNWKGKNPLMASMIWFTMIIKVIIKYFY